ncbi:MAG: GNAT family N-acetyltransferase [Bdellovibrionales bacterium]|jgi:GNAT superfamily N-acetyltransferase
MKDLTYKKVRKSDEQQLRTLISNVLAATPPEFFIPYEEWELDSLYDESYALLHGAYDGETLAGIAQLYVQQEMLKSYKEEMGLSSEKVCELGGNLVLSEYRGQKIQYNLMQLQFNLARDIGFKHIITMAHPDNVASLKSIQRLGLKFMKKSHLSNGFLRDLYYSEL